MGAIGEAGAATCATCRGAAGWPPRHGAIERNEMPMPPVPCPQTDSFANQIRTANEAAELARQAAFAAGETEDRAGALAGATADRHLVAAVEKLPVISFTADEFEALPEREAEIGAFCEADEIPDGLWKIDVRGVWVILESTGDTYSIKRPNVIARCPSAASRTH